MNVSAYEKFVRKRFGSRADSVLAAYPAKTPADAQYQVERIMMDVDFAQPALMVAGSNAALNRSTWLYRFSYAMPGQQLGAFHGSELFFVFRPGFMNPDPASSRVSDTVMTFWTNFAKTGNPNGDAGAGWPQFDNSTGRKYLDIGAEPVVKTGY